MSTPVIQAIAACAVRDGATHPDIVTISKLGTDGKYANNMYAELCRKLVPTPVTTALDTINVWVKKSGKPPVKVAHHILLPHKLFACLYHNHRDVFVRSVLGGSPEEPKKFWQSQQANPSYKDHPVAKRGTHMTHAIPLALHGDGVSTSGCGKTWAKSCDAYSWRSVLAKGANLVTSNFLIYIIFGKLLIKSGNMDAFEKFQRKLTWSFYWLFLGRWPSRDENGNEYTEGSAEWKQAHNDVHLADGYFGVLWFLLGDLEHMHKAWKLAPPRSTTRSCSCCRANASDDDKPWTDGRLAVASWVPTIWKNTPWAAAFPDRAYIFKHLPGFGIEQYCPDMMHILHLGCYQYIFGSVIKVLTHHHMH